MIRETLIAMAMYSWKRGLRNLGKKCSNFGLSLSHIGFNGIDEGINPLCGYFLCNYHSWYRFTIMEYSPCFHDLWNEGHRDRKTQVEIPG